MGKEQVKEGHIRIQVGSPPGDITEGSNEYWRIIARDLLPSFMDDECNCQSHSEHVLAAVWRMAVVFWFL